MNEHDPTALFVQWVAKYTPPIDFENEDDEREDTPGGGASMNECRYCHGSGRVQYALRGDWDVCSGCGGKGTTGDTPGGVQPSAERETDASPSVGSPTADDMEDICYWMSMGVQECEGRDACAYGRRVYDRWCRNA